MYKLASEENFNFVKKTNSLSAECLKLLEEPKRAFADVMVFPVEKTKRERKKKEKILMLCLKSIMPHGLYLLYVNIMENIRDKARTKKTIESLGAR